MALKTKYTRHGYSKHPLYRVWTYMKSRCENPNDTRYADYGGRGVVICKEWATNPKNFVEWGLSNGWSKGLSLDRADNDGDYTPSNCRFVTISESNVNQRIRKDNTTGLRGISHRRGYWIPRLQYKGERVEIGYYKNPEDAVIARAEYIVNNNLPHIADGG